VDTKTPIETAYKKTLDGGWLFESLLSSRQMKKRKLGHEGLVPESKGSQAL
jgi:hypothetical protein